MEKLYSSKTCLKMAGGAMHPPHPPLGPPLPAVITMSLATTPASRFGFNMMQGKFCRSCFKITARTASTVWTLHFKNKNSVSKGREFRLPQLPPPWCATVDSAVVHYMICKI